MAGAIEFSITAPDIDKVTKALGRLVPGLRPGLDALLGEEARATAASIASQWPVRTGRSRAAWEAIRLAEAQWAVRNEVDYVPYVHRAGEVAILVDTMVQQELAQSRARLRARLKSLSTRALERTNG